MSPTVLIVDDQPLFAQGLAMVLGAQGDVTVTGTPSSGREALELLEHETPDAIILDLRMPGMSGLEVLSALRAQGNRTPVLVLTTLRQEHAVYESLRLGAAGFLTKDAAPEMLVDTLRRIVDGDTAVGAPELRQLLSKHGQRPRPGVTALPELTERERAVFMLCARGLDNAAIAEHECVSVATVKSQVSAVLRKLRLTSRVQIPIHAYEHGILLPSPGRN